MMARSGSTHSKLKIKDLVHARVMMITTTMSLVTHVTILKIRMQLNVPQMEISAPKDGIISVNVSIARIM